MKRSINQISGLGNAEVYLCLQSGATFYNFTTLAWGAAPIVAACKIFGTEYALPSGGQSRYEFNFTPPTGGPWDIEYFRQTTGDLLGIESTQPDDTTAIKIQTDKFTFDAANNVKSAPQTAVTIAPTQYSPGVLQNTVTVVDAKQQRITRGDQALLTFNLGTSWPLTGKKVYFAAKADARADNFTAIVNRACNVTDAINGIATIILTPVETAVVGIYYAEVEVRDSNDANPQTAMQFLLRITQDIRQ